MTIGQRIAMLRKDGGLSQEDLGGKLGVSRQSIYKWESDASIPEIDKLIALSKLFGVSVGWLLGVEEEHTEEKEDADAKSDELSEQQLKMVEEIVARYIAAQPKPAPKLSPKKRNLLICAGVIAALVLAVSFSDLNRNLNQLDHRYRTLQNEISGIQNNVSSEIYGISNRVEEILKSQNNLTASYDTELLSIDPGENTATFSLRATPKTYVDGMRAVFCATQNETGETTEVTGTLGANQEFSAELTCPLSDGIDLSVTFVSGEKKEQQFLQNYGYLYSDTIPWVIPEGHDMMYTPVTKGEVFLDAIYFTTDENITSVLDIDNTQIRPAAIREVRIGLFKNQELVSWADACAQPENWHGDFGGDIHFYRLPNMTVPIKEGDVLSVAAIVTDEYGRENLCRGDDFWLDKSDDRLTWADSDWTKDNNDIKNWKY